MDEKNQAVQTETTQVEDTSRPVSTETTVADTLREAVTETPSTPSDQKGGADTEKQTRLERRVDTLVDKLKQTTQQPSDPTQIFGNQDLFTKEELEAGAFDPQALQSRLAEREQKVSQLASQQAVAALKYESAVNEHIADIDSVKGEIGSDPELDTIVAEQYTALNTIIDPRTGARAFVPQVKMSDIYKKFKAVVDKKATAAAADVTNKVTQQATEQAVPVSVSQAPSEDLEGKATFEKATQSGATEDWAAVLKRRIKK